MFEIEFYQDESGVSVIREYIRDLELKAEKSKDSRVKLKNIVRHIELLSKYGTQIKEPYIKHISNDIWELRPLRDRIFFFLFRKNTFVLLHMFQKKTQKTPNGEIEQAKRNKESYIRRFK